MTTEDPKQINLKGAITSGPGILSGRLTVTPVDSVKVEESTTRKYLRMRNGDFECYSRVLVSVEGEWTEITVDCLPMQEE